MSEIISFVEEPLIIRRSRLKNKNFTIISQNCVGGYIYHQMEMKFLTPTINLYFFPKDFVDLVNHLHFFMERADLTEDRKAPEPFPVGILGDQDRHIRIYFNHDNDFNKAKSDWERRKHRINYNNIYIVGGDAYGQPYSKDDMETFDHIKFPHKVLLTGRKWSGINSCFAINNCSINEHLGQWWNLIPNNVRGSRYFEQWDYVKFLNQGCNHNGKFR